MGCRMMELIDNDYIEMRRIQMRETGRVEALDGSEDEFKLLGPPTANP
jgi:hypothetical protein